MKTKYIVSSVEMGRLNDGTGRSLNKLDFTDDLSPAFGGLFDSKIDAIEAIKEHGMPSKHYNIQEVYRPER